VKLSELMSGMGLSGYAQVALVLFLVVFASQTFRVLRPSLKRYWNDLGNLPLDGDEGGEP
jgi:hypothetical protein